MDRYERILSLHRILKTSRYPVTVAKLQDELECSRATVYRDLAFLRDALMAPIVGDGDAGFRPPGPEPGPGYAGRRQNPLNASVGPPYSTGRFTAAEVLSNMALLNDRATKEAAQSCRSISFFTASASQSCHEGAFGRLEISHVMVRSRPPVKQRRGGSANRFPSMWARRSVPRKTVGLRLTN